MTSHEAGDPRMITLVHLERSRSERIVWLLEELGLPYRLESFHRRPDVFAPDDLKGVHALGKAPVIRDGAVTLAESGAIVEYLLARYGHGRLAIGPEAPNFARYLYWLHYAEGSLMLHLSREYALDRMLPEPDAHPGMARIRAGTRAHLALIDAALSEGPYFAGETFTAADIMMGFPFTTYRQFRPMDLAPYPALTAWVARIEARPAFRTSVAPIGT